jgi:hypothetical protein
MDGLLVRRMIVVQSPIYAIAGWFVELLVIPIRCLVAAGSDPIIGGIEEVFDKIRTLGRYLSENSPAP